jgi:hypothetical protein
MSCGCVLGVLRRGRFVTRKTLVARHGVCCCRMEKMPNTVTGKASVVDSTTSTAPATTEATASMSPACWTVGAPQPCSEGHVATKEATATASATAAPAATGSGEPTQPGCQRKPRATPTVAIRWERPLQAVVLTTTLITLAFVLNSGLGNGAKACCLLPSLLMLVIGEVLPRVWRAREDAHAAATSTLQGVVADLEARLAQAGSASARATSLASQLTHANSKAALADRTAEYLREQLRQAQAQAQAQARGSPPSTAAPTAVVLEAAAGGAVGLAGAGAGAAVDRALTNQMGALVLQAFTQQVVEAEPTVSTGKVPGHRGGPAVRALGGTLGGILGGQASPAAAAAAAAPRHASAGMRFRRTTRPPVGLENEGSGHGGPTKTTAQGHGGPPGAPMHL